MILVTGASGFIGRELVAALRAQGKPVRALVRSEARGQALRELGCELALGDMTAPASLRSACDGAEVVVHLVAIIRGRATDFERVMTAGTRALIEAAQEAKVKRFILVSALGLNAETREETPYYRAKWAEEQALLESGLEYVIFRPSFVFDASGGALPTFVHLVRYSPVTPVLGPGTQLIQPVAIEDVAHHLAAAVSLEGARNRSFDLAGPDRVTWDELYALIARTLGKHRKRLHIPFALAHAQAAAFGWAPGFPFTRDQLRMIAAGDNTGDIAPLQETFGLPLSPLAAQLTAALAPK
jgi:NADH dehydrogenase